MLVCLILWSATDLTVSANFSCAAKSINCARADNQGWRYLYFTAGGTVLVMSLLRVTIIRFHETPKFSLCQNKDEQVVTTLGGIAEKYRPPFGLIVEQLEQCGEVSTSHARRKASFSELAVHYRELFQTRILTISTLLV